MYRKSLTIHTALQTYKVFIYVKDFPESRQVSWCQR